MIHSGLRDSLARIEAHFQGDRRCVAMYLWGSLGNGTADSFSDVDVAIVVEDGEVEAVKSELRSLCETLCGPILAWLPEGERPQACNFAFLFAHDDEVLLYDFYLSSVADAYKGPGAAPKKVIFDRNSLFTTTESTPSNPVPRADGLLRDITTYWIYMYLNGKYYSRNDIYKMLYVQQVLFQTYLKVLLAMRGIAQAGWWVGDVQRLSESHQKELKLFFTAPNAQALVQTLWREADLFSRDARAACVQSGLEYPGDLEDAVRGHLQLMGLGGA